MISYYNKTMDTLSFSRKDIRRRLYTPYQCSHSDNLLTTLNPTLCSASLPFCNLYLNRLCFDRLSVWALRRPCTGLVEQLSVQPPPESQLETMFRLFIVDTGSTSETVQSVQFSSFRIPLRYAKVDDLWRLCILHKLVLFRLYYRV